MITIRDQLYQNFGNTTQELREMAFSDPLTDLPNYRLMNLHLKNVLDEADRSNHSVGFLMLDLDNFKALNDSLGHSVANTVLCTIADRLDDATNGNDLPVRMHGDEFCIIRRRMNNLDRLLFFAKRMADIVNQSINLQGQTIQVSCSIGVAVYPLHAQDKDGLLKVSDEAMYIAKNQSNGRAWHLYQPSDST